MASPALRFKIDENLPTEAVQRLKDAGFDALSVRDQRLEGAPDSRIAKERVLHAIGRVAALIATEPIKGHLWIVDEAAVRIRKG